MKKALLSLALCVIATLGFSQEKSNVPLFSSGYMALPGSIGEFTSAGSVNSQGINHSVFSLNSLTAGNQVMAFSIPQMNGVHGPQAALTRAGVNYSLDESTAIVASLGYYSAGVVEARDNEGNILGTLNPNEFDVRVGVVKQLADDFNVGVRLGYLSTNLGSSMNSATITESAIIVDFSLDYVIKSTDQFDLKTYWALNNVGKKSNFSEGNLNYLPAQMAMGVVLDYSLNSEVMISPQLQLQRFLVPTPPIYNADGTIFAGQAQNPSFLGSLFTSFNDAPEGISEEVKEWCPILSVQTTLKEKILLNVAASLESQEKGNRQFISMGVGYKTAKVDLMAGYIIPMSTTAGFYDNLAAIGISYKL